MKRIAVLILWLFCLSGPVVALMTPEERLGEPVLEERAKNISAQLRCLVCQNQSIIDSDASLARDLRLLVRERLQAGDSDEETIGYIVERYGEFVLLKPVFAPHTLLLWLAAPAILFMGLGGILLAHARRKKIAPEPGAPALGDKEREILAQFDKDR